MIKQFRRFIKVFAASGYYLLVAFPVIVSAAQLTLQWNPNTPAPDGYNLYMRLDGQTYDYSAPLNSSAITGTTFSVGGLVEGSTYHFVVRAEVSGVEGVDSNEVSYLVPVSNPDTDGDGYNDSVDAFPTDSTEWLDTDSDGIGNNADTDDDGDSLPDAWETLYGLDPLDGSDGSGDLDGDGISNLDEYNNGSDPSQVPGNSVPDQPVLVAPANGASGIDLMPILMTAAYVDPEGDNHVSTRYQIATSTNWTTDLVFDGLFTQNLTSITLADLILDPETTYYWRVQFTDEHNGQSQWSAAWTFTTMDNISAGYPDDDGNGIVNAQEVPAGNIDPGLNVANGMVVVGTADTTNPQLGVLLSTNADIVSIRAMDAGSVELGSSANRPEVLTGLVSFKLGLLNGATSASITVYLLAPAPQDAVWYKYNLENGWVPYSNVTFSSDRKSVTIHLVDGGVGDDDGVQNGVIVDPSGLGYSASDGSSLGYSTQTSDVSGSSGSSFDGCFISTPLGEVPNHHGKNTKLLMLLSLVCMAVMMMGIAGRQ